ncbi:FAD/NAD(P)-binding protein [Brevundimonas sp. FT23028]|uniref:FAD/NAD(P)-binding protein n=1 Tax=Brevundimonas sp. FT23028 TaxID=3393748 RepID=UPI003B589533
MAANSQPVVIVGGGFSGAMLAARLAEAGVASTLIDRSGRFGRGVAYSTTFDGHLLNVRANRMSAVEGQPNDFVDWLAVHAPDRADPDGFAPRRLYGAYLEHRLARVDVAHPGRITRIVGEAAAIEEAGVRLADGRMIAGARAVLATGNPAPSTARRLSGERIVSDPWRPGALDRIGETDHVLILGTGLTMVDVLLELTAGGWRGVASTLSRRGLTPRAHGDRPDAPVPPTEALLHGAPSQRLREARRLSDQAGWRGVMEGLRPVTAALWRETDPTTRARLLRHLRPWWDVHRHRIAGTAADQLDALRRAGRWTVAAGAVLAIEPAAQAVSLAYRPRGGVGRETLTGSWLIDCTGPTQDPARDALTAPLLTSGRARLEALEIGLDLDARGRIRAADGGPDPRLLALGPPARAAFWETTAVPDIRKRIEAMVKTLTEPPA